MRKSGLHKQISSIFDGVPVPNKNLPEAMDASEDMLSDGQEPNEHLTPTEPASVPQDTRPSLVKRMSADPSTCASSPAIAVGRPMPLPKSSAMAVKTGPGFSSQIRKTVFGSKGSLDPRQKKMAGLVGILSLVFGVVMFVSLGGVGQSKATAGTDPSQDSVIQNQETKKAAKDWTSPQTLPANLRDATQPVFKQTNATDDGLANTGSGDLVVKGIVFSKNKPSAIINNEILTEGESINGATIVKITKDAVEFKANDKQWTQQVQR